MARMAKMEPMAPNPALALALPMKPRTFCCLKTKLTDESCIGRDAFVVMCWMRDA